MQKKETDLILKDFDFAEKVKTANDQLSKKVLDQEKELGRLKKIEEQFDNLTFENGQLKMKVEEIPLLIERLD